MYKRQIGNFPSEESVFIRKAPHTYGWDILPRLVSAGLWRDVELRVLNPARLTDVHYMVANVDTATRNVRLYTDVQVKLPFEKFDKVKAVYTLSRHGKEIYKGSSVVVSPAFRYIMEIKNADLWWPRGYGEPALYDAKVELVDSDGTILSTDNKRVGLRTIQLDITDINLPPDHPGKFCFIVNGEPIFIHGTNWVPMDALHSRDHSFVDESIRMAVELNCNMIRCWGGNVYEDHHFFNLCDETALWYGRILRWDVLSILNAAHLHKHWKKRPFPLYASYAIIHHSFYGQEIMKTIVHCAGLCNHLILIQIRM